MGKLKWKDNPRDFSQVIVWGGKCACGLSKLTWLCFLIIFILLLEQLRVSILSVVWISLTACKAITPFISFKDLTAAGGEWMGFVEWLEDPVFSCNVLTGTRPRELIAGDDIWLLARSCSATSYGQLPCVSSQKQLLKWSLESKSVFCNLVFASRNVGEWFFTCEVLLLTWPTAGEHAQAQHGWIDSYFIPGAKIWISNVCQMFCPILGEGILFNQ